MEFLVARNLSHRIQNELGTNRIRRINWQHMAILGCVVLLGLLSIPVYNYWNARSVRDSALNQATEAKKRGEVDLALRHLDRYLGSHPDDLGALDLKAKILSEVELADSQLLGAANVLDHLVRLDPKGAGRLATRRKLAEFYIRYSDDLKRYAEASPDPDLERQQSRYAAAASIASLLVDDAKAGGYQDSAAHRLLAKAFEGQISDVRFRSSLTRKGSDGASKKSKEDEERDLRLRAIQEYRTALELDPTDLEAGTRLANIFLEWMHDTSAADQVLDTLLKASPQSVKVRLIRYQVFTKSQREELAEAELKAILQLEPDNVDVRLNIAQVALSRRGPRSLMEARRQLDAIPPEKQEYLPVRILRGYIEFADAHPLDAIDQWKRGLLLVGGTDQDLTWRLAYNLVKLKKYDEAEPLRKRYAQLAQGDRNGIGKFLDALFDVGYGKLYDARKKLEKIKDVIGKTYQVEVLLALGQCCALMGDSEAALLAYRSAAAAAPNAASPRLMIARHLQKRQPDEAIAELDRALADHPDEINLLLEATRLRLIYLAARLPADPRRVRELEELFRRIDALNPNQASLLAYRAEFLSLTNQLDRAVNTLAEAAKGDARKQSEIWLNLAQALDRSNRRVEAIQALDRAMLAENAGDHSDLRIAKARLLAKAGKGQAARDVLAKESGRLSLSERAELAQSLAELLRELGDREGAIEAYSEWARLTPKVPGPALSLLAMAQVDHDDAAAKRGLEALRSIGGDQEPYGIAARALELMRTDPNRPTALPADRLYEAELLVKRLRQDVPSLRLGSLLEGMVFEYKKDFEAAARSYRAAIKDEIVSPGLPKLIEVLIKLKRFDELGMLRNDFEKEVAVRQGPGLLAEFDRIAASASLRLGERDRADYFASMMIADGRDDVTTRTAVAMMLDQNNQPEQAEASLKALVKDRPNEPSTWLTLIAFLAIRRTPADVNRTIEQAKREFKGERAELFAANCYYIGKDIAKAKEYFKRAASARPDDLATLQSLASFYDKTDQDDEVEPILRKALKLDPSSSWAARSLALKLTERADPSSWQEAWSLVAPGSSTSGDTPQDRLIRATILARSTELRRREEAVAAFGGLANDLPISSELAVETRVRLSQAMIDAGRVVDAWDAIRPVADSMARPNVLALSLAIEALARSNQPEEAQRRLDRLVKLDPKSPQARIATSWVLNARGKNAEAAANLESTYQEFSSAPNAQLIGTSVIDRMLRFGDRDCSLRVAQDVARRWPTDAWLLARVHLLRKEFDKTLEACEVALAAGSAREAFRYASAAATSRPADPNLLRKVSDLGTRARLKDPKDFNIPVFMATIRHLEGRYDQELACYRDALDLFPSNAGFLNNMAWTLCEGLHQPEEAMKYVEEAIRREGEYPQHLDTRGVIEERLGQLEKAIADLERSAKADPLAATYFHLARVYWRANDQAASRRNRDLALKANFDPAKLDPTDRGDLEAVMGKP